MVTALLFASPLHAERWTKAGSNSSVGDDWAFCVDLDSVTTGADGWTSYRVRMCGEPSVVYENAIQCDQDLSGEQASMRQRIVVANGKPKPDQPWTTSSIYLSSMSGQMARFVCHK
jgi:hypothetical protein